MWSAWWINIKNIKQLLRVNLIWVCRYTNKIQFLPDSTTIIIILRMGQLNGTLKLTIIICSWVWISWLRIPASITCRRKTASYFWVKVNNSTLYPLGKFYVGGLPCQQSSSYFGAHVHNLFHAHIHHDHNVHHTPLHGLCIFQIISSLHSCLYLHSYQLNLLQHFFPLLIHHHCLYHCLLLWKHRNYVQIGRAS